MERGLGRVRTRIPINKELKQLQRRRGQPERQKRNGFMCEKATTLHVHHTFWHFFSLLNATFYGGRERAATNFFLSPSLFLKIVAFFLSDAK